MIKPYLHQANRPRGAFSLVEMLVCMGVIAILIATLLPPINAARDGARTIGSLSNIRHVGIRFTPTPMNMPICRP